jgi:molybdate transport repressor ModE-like protein
MPDNWQSIDLRHLMALRAIAEAGTFWQAAERLHTSHSTISDHIVALEKLTGHRLVERSRGRRSVRLTEAGHLLAAHATEIEARLRAAEADVRALEAGESGTLRVGIYQSLANRMLPEVMMRFSSSWPRIDLQVAEVLDDPQLLDGIDRGALDLCFDVQPIPAGPFETRDLLHDPYVVVVAASSDLVGRAPTAADLGRLPMVGYLPSRTFELVESYMAAAGAAPRLVYRSNDNATVQAMVAAGLGFAVMPRLAVGSGDPRLALVDLAQPMPPRVITAVWHRYRRHRGIGRRRDRPEGRVWSRRGIVTQTTDLTAERVGYGDAETPGAAQRRPR